jgi:hypothetical protein
MDQVLLPEVPPRTVAVEPAPARLAGRLRRPLVGRVPVGLALAGLVLVSLLLRLEGQGTWLWTDEGISVGIASHPLSAIPRVLRRDGSPPLYYVLLHGWMRAVGTSEAQTHALSLVFALAMVPVALWAGWSLFGRRVGWICAALAATSSYLDDFSHETRMYTLVALLGFVAAASFLHAFAFRRRRYVPLFVVSLAMLLYTHNWGIYFAVAAALAVVPCVVAAPDRRRAGRDAALAFVAVGVVYAPWVPTLLAQAAHTGAPWSARPVAREMISALGDVLGDPHERVLVALVLGGGAAILGLLRRYRTPEGRAVVAALVLGGATLAAGWLSAQVEPAWSYRYLAVLLGPVLILAAVALARGGGHGLAALLLILVFWTQPLGRLTGLRQPVHRDQKSAVKPIADVVRPKLGPGDVVVAMQMEEVPVLRYYLPAGVRYADVTGPVQDPRVVDWRDALDRVQHSTVEHGLVPLVDALPANGHVFLVCTGDFDSPRTLAWFKLMDERCGQWRAALADDSRLKELLLPGVDDGDPERTRSVHLFEKSSG